MWSDAARLASIQARGGSQAAPGGGGGGGNVVTQGNATQQSFKAAAASTNPYAGRAARGQIAGQQTGNAARPQTGGTSNVSEPAPAAHATGVSAVARSMGGNGSQMDTRPDKTAIDRASAGSAPTNSYQTQRSNNTIDNIAARQPNATMVGDHTTPPALQKYLD